jgi:hypothetical protein
MYANSQELRQLDKQERSGAEGSRHTLICVNRCD